MSCRDSANSFYILDIFQTELDASPLQQIMSSVSSFPIAEGTAVLWTAAARQIWLNVFAPNDPDLSILRSSLLANNLDTLTFYYSGSRLIFWLKLMARLLDRPFRL